MGLLIVYGETAKRKEFLDSWNGTGIYYDVVTKHGDSAVAMYASA